MSSVPLIEAFGRIVYGFTRGLTEHYNPEEPEYTAEILGCSPLESTGREWYHKPVKELIYQEYGENRASPPSFNLDIRIINASSTQESDEPLKNNVRETSEAMAWKSFRPSIRHTICDSMYIGSLISLLAAIGIGTIYIALAFLIYKTVMNCQYQKEKMTSRQQWMRTTADVVSCALIYFSPVLNLLFLFRSFQLKGLRRKLLQTCLIIYCLDSLYRVTLQLMGKPFFTVSVLYVVPVYTLWVFSSILQFYLVARHFLNRSKQKRLLLLCKMSVPTICCIILGFCMRYFVYPAYNKEKKEERKLVIALFSPLAGLVLKAASRICVQRLWNITHPGYSYVLLAPLYFGSAIIVRGLQAELNSLQSIAILGIIHGAAEVVERSTIVVIDHVCHSLRTRKASPWGSFRTPRRERLVADVAIMSMLYESTAIVSVNGSLYMYQLIFLETTSVTSMIKEFALSTSVMLVIEWFFTSVSLAIETRYQNMAVMAIWRCQWKRHTLVAILNVMFIGVWVIVNLLKVVQGHFEGEPLKQCKMPFS